MRPLWLLAVLLAALPASAGNKETAPGSIPQVPTLAPVVGSPNLSVGAPNLTITAVAPGYVGYDAALHALPQALSAQPVGRQAQALAPTAAFQSPEHERLYHELFGAQPQPQQAAQAAAQEESPRPNAGHQLRRTLREGGAFDGADEKAKPLDAGVWRDPRILASVQQWEVSEPRSGPAVSDAKLLVAAAHGVSRGLGLKLIRLEGLSDAAWRKLLKEAAATKIKIDRALPFSQSMSVSLELEFQLAKNIKDADIKDEKLAKAWNETGELPSDAWNSVSKKKMKAIRSARPRGWDDDHSQGDSFGEMRTKPRGRKYYSNKPRHWAELLQGLENVQAQMPHGFYSVHGHFGREGRDLGIDTGAFARFVAAYEAPLRALAGRGWTLPKGSLDGGIGRLSSGRDGWTGHADPFNVSDSYPTIEIKVLDGLADKGGKAHFDTKALLKDLYFAFALVERFKDGQTMPLVEVGVPYVRGEKPTPLQQQRFLDQLFGDDVLGKAIALQRLAGLADAAPALDEAGLAEKREYKRKVFDRMGLGVLFDIHEAAGGYDAHWRRALLADDAKLLRRLVADINGKPGTSLAAIFPQDFVPVVRLAMSDVAQAEARTTAEASLRARPSRYHAVQLPGLWESFLDFAWNVRFRLEAWFDRHFGPAPEPRLAGHEEDRP